MYMEFSTCESLGIPYSEFMNLPAWEKTGWKIFYLVKGKRERMWRDEAERKQNMKPPKVR